jgi:hypothetical protein
MLTRRDRNKLYEIIRAWRLDPTDLSLAENGNIVRVTHRSGSTFVVSLIDQFAIAATGYHGVGFNDKYGVVAEVPDGMSETSSHTSIDTVIYRFGPWLDSIRLAEAPDYWAEMQRSAALISSIQAGQDNDLFREDELEQIAASLEKIKKQLAEGFELTSEQLEHVCERLDETAEASRRMGRKDWLVYFLGTVTALIMTATVSAGIGEHIFSVVIQGTINIFTSGNEPPQIPG